MGGTLAMKDTEASGVHLKNTKPNTIYVDYLPSIELELSRFFPERDCEAQPWDRNKFIHAFSCGHEEPEIQARPINYSPSPNGEHNDIVYIHSGA